MGQLGEMFPGRKLRGESGDSGTGEEYETGPLDLSSGLVRLAPRPKPPEPDAANDDDDE